MLMVQYSLEGLASQVILVPTIAIPEKTILGFLSCSWRSLKNKSRFGQLFASMLNLILSLLFLYLPFGKLAIFIQTYPFRIKPGFL
jgi:hypothetical protein